MLRFIKSLFKCNTPTIHVNNIQDLFPFYDPDKFTVGFRKGSLDQINRARFLKGESFTFLGSPNDFVILLKSDLKEASSD